MSTKELTYRFGADYSALLRGQDKALDGWRKERRELQALQAQQREHHAAMTDLGSGLVTFGAVVAAGLGLATKAAIEWESAFTGVRKTVDGSDAEIASLEKELRGLAKTLPATHEEIAGVAEAAGQLGIKRQDIAAFTKTMIDLGNTTNLTAEQAATDLAKFSNIMGTSAGDVDKLGSALVALGNDGASTEADIISMGLRIAAAGKQVGMTEAQVLAFASSLSSVGIEAEAGGSSFSTAMIKMSVAANQGGESLDTFARVAGMSADAFSRKFKQDAAGAMIVFIQGLRRMQDTGGDVFGVLDKLGLSEIRVRDAMLRAAGASEMFTHSLEVGTDAWIENTALTEEANKRYETAASRLQVSGNQIKDAMIDVGAAIAPAFAAGAQSVADVVRAFSELPGPVKDIITYVGLAAAGITLVGGAALIAVPKVLAFRESMTALSTGGGAATSALGKFGLFMSGPWGVGIAAGIGLLGLFAAGLGAASRKQQEMAASGADVARAIREQNGAMNDSVRGAAAKAAAEAGLLGKAKELGLELPRITDAILGQGNAYDSLITSLDATIGAGDAYRGTSEKTLEQLKAERDAARELKSGLIDLVDGKNAELEKTKDVSAATKDATVATSAQSEALDEEKRATEEVKTAFDGLIKTLNDLNGITLSSREAQRDYLAQLAETGEVLAKNGKGLDNTTEKGRENAAALDAQAKAAGELAEALAREAEKQGGAAAGTAAFKASLDASRPALIKQAEAFGMSHEEAVRYADSVLAAAGETGHFARVAQAELARVAAAVHGIPPGKTVNVGVLSEDAKKKLGEIGYKVETLPDGTVNVTAATKAAEDALNWLARPRTALVTVNTRQGVGWQSPGGQIFNARGNVVSFASGGTWENHRPQVVRATPGTVRIWAEPETGGESYIPHAMDRRPAAIGVLGYTADKFGLDLVPRTQSAGAVRASYMSSTRSVDASLSIGTVVVGSMQEVADMERQRRAHALFAQGLT